MRLYSCVRLSVFMFECDAILPACSGSFRHSLVLTSTAEPRGTFTTDLASHFQCSDGRPLVSVSTVPSSFQITSPYPPPPPPPLLFVSLSFLICLNLPMPLTKRKPQTGQIFSILSSCFCLSFCVSLFPLWERNLCKREKKDSQCLITIQQRPVE